jgi:MFS superfamily sulfate permease-like transporter
VSANRELVALGVANMLGGLFMSIPAFGGYGRSKVNASTGGKTPMSSVFLSLITVFCVLFLLPYFYYIPVSPTPSTPQNHPPTNTPSPPRKPSSPP